MRRSLVGTAVTLAVGTLLTAAMTTASASPGAAATPTPEVRVPRPVLVDCLWHQDVRPADFILACGDGNSRLTGLHWAQWGPREATAIGMNVVNDCKPYCAAGTFHAYPVIVRLDDPMPWKKHPDVQHYTRMSLIYTDARPEGFGHVMTYPLWD
ncbi:hypothetical protein LK07_01745 [Streptomyces pluripotens]|uniref:Secreted protein n=1 Tax=Streptomyces pluripotens TaxID=1355015 RepID=A0A221NTT5_9ACTN|nr:MULTISPECIES: hypothetical protein [Streptomyces]ARP68700.1 hypothetical protein LK06_000665 [Streptomyces pluripotens]ASN22955.1 hypothetical protein LK07_01745 [Streptomyces pluripotens]KIE26678.1 hypothetical protein LK08_12125 [Streptomyces sp. MUSC 125]MCH0559202.1 hypothetical protein [Streptomyces sp. MUM 16J]